METESVAASGKGVWSVHWPLWGTKAMFEMYEVKNLVFAHCRMNSSGL